jgi:hypothetical protein
LKCLQGGRVHPLAVCGVAPVFPSPTPLVETETGLYTAVCLVQRPFSLSPGAKARIVRFTTNESPSSRARQEDIRWIFNLNAFRPEAGLYPAVIANATAAADADAAAARAAVDMLACMELFRCAAG